MMRGIALYVCLAVAIATPAQAAPLLTDPFELQLETWLGEGALDFFNVYTKETGDTATDFHAAADNKGPTVTLIHVFSIYDSIEYVIGGYNPQSWDAAIHNYVMTPDDADRTGFLFNLTTGRLNRQKLTTSPDGSGMGAYQTMNASMYGPTFGGGHDIYIDASLAQGDDIGWSYGGPWDMTGVLPGISGNGPDFNVKGLEVYTFAPTQSVPEPASLLLFGAAAAGLIVSRRRSRSAVPGAKA